METSKRRNHANESFVMDGDSKRRNHANECFVMDGDSKRRNHANESFSDGWRQQTKEPCE